MKGEAVPLTFKFLRLRSSYLEAPEPNKDISLDLSKLPPELWAAIFNSLDRTSDLASITASSKLFRSLTLRTLLKHMRWPDARTFALNMPLFTNNPSLYSAPTTLTLGLLIPGALNRFDRSIFVVDYTGHNSIFKVEAPDNSFIIGGLWIPMDETALEPQILGTETNYLGRAYICADLVLAMAYQQASMFKNLDQLVLMRTVITDDLYKLLANLPNLRQLSILRCYFDHLKDPPQSFDHLQLHRLIISDNEIDASTRARYEYAVMLATAPTLRLLKLDWSDAAARVLAGPFHGTSHSMSPHLSSLELITGENFIAAEVTSLLYAFLAKCTSVEKFKFSKGLIHLPQQSPGPLVLPNLQTFIGSLACTKSIMVGRNLTSLETWDFFQHVSTEEGDQSRSPADDLALIAAHSPRLQSLTFSLLGWDEEILYVLKHFPELRYLCIRYGVGYPSEQCLLSLGARFIQSDLPKLMTFRLLHPTRLKNVSRSKTKDGYTNARPDELPDDDIKELILPWSKCKGLREVQLVHGSVWQRSRVGCEWTEKKSASFSWG